MLGTRRSSVCAFLLFTIACGDDTGGSGGSGGSGGGTTVTTASGTTTTGSTTGSTTSTSSTSTSSTSTSSTSTSSTSTTTSSTSTSTTATTTSASTTTATATASSTGGTGGGGGDPIADYCGDACAFTAQLEQDLMCGIDQTNCFSQCVTGTMVDPQCIDELQAFGVCVFALPSSDFLCDPMGYIVNTTACDAEINAFVNCP